MGHPFGSLANFFARFFGGGEGLVAGGGDSLAWLAADGVAEGILEALGTTAGREAVFCAVLLPGVALAVAAAGPGRAGLAETAGAVEGNWEDEEADASVQDAALGEAGGDQEKDEQGAEGGAEDRLDRAVLDREGSEAEQRQQHQRRRDHRGVDRAAPLLRPVDVVEVDPEGELVDRQAGADPEGEGADLGPGTVAEGGEAAGARDHHRHDPEDEVVEVDAAVADDAAGPPGDLRAAHQPRAHANEGEGEKEADEDQVETLQLVLGDAVPEVGDDRGGGHAGSGAECRGGAPPSFSRIRSRVSRTAATAKIGERAMSVTASASQVARK